MISQAHSRLANWDEAVAVASQAAQAAEKAGDPRPLADALTRLGITLMDRSPSKAIDYFQQAFEIFRGVDDRCGVARCSINLGITYARRGEAAEAERAYAAASRLHGRPRLGPRRSRRLNLGVHYLKPRPELLPRERFKEALQAFTSANSEPHRLATLLNLATSARENGHWDDSVSLYAEVIASPFAPASRTWSSGARADRASRHSPSAGCGRGGRSAYHRGACRRTARLVVQGREIVDALRGALVGRAARFRAAPGS
jgi:tetratricopeptide (TPR) repeat protein